MSARPPWDLPYTSARLRPATPADYAAVSRFLAAMDREGLYDRHFAHGEAPNQALLARLQKLDDRNRAAILAIAPDARIVGHAEYVADGSGVEFALMLLPAFRDRGIGRAMIAELLTKARNAGHARMTGTIQATNTRAIMAVRKLGFKLVPGDDRRTVLVSRELAPAHESAQPLGLTGQETPAPPLIIHDIDRTPLHSSPGP